MGHNVQQIVVLRLSNRSYWYITDIYSDTYYNLSLIMGHNVQQIVVLRLPNRSYWYITDIYSDKYCNLSLN